MLGPGVQNNLVDVAMECLIREVGQLFNALPVVIHVVRRFTELVIFRVFPCEDAGSTCVKPVARLRRRMAL